MIQKTKLPEDFIASTREKKSSFEPMVEKLTIEGVDEFQYLYVYPWTCINMHGHEGTDGEDGQWEVWLRLWHQEAYICPKGEQHELINDKGTLEVVMAIKGHSACSYDDLAIIFRAWGFSVKHGSMVIRE